MTEKWRDSEEDIERALDILETVGSDKTDAQIDGAFRTLVGLLPPTSPRHGFSERVITAVAHAPLPAGRRKLHSRRPARIAAVIGTAAALAFAALLWAIPLLGLLAQVFVVLVHGGVAAIRWVSLIPEAWRWMDLTARPLVEVMGSMQMLSLFAAVTLLSFVVLAALQRVVSASRPVGIKGAIKC